MMTSTFPNIISEHNLKNGVKEIQSKKETLVALEVALKKRVSELRELCLKEGELTGHLPIDYPLQPREPIPQIRRRINNNNNNLNDTNSIAPPCSRQHKLDPVQPQAAIAISSNTSMWFPSRPTSTNSTSSSISTASSNTRNNNHLNNNDLTSRLLAPSSSNQPSLNNDHCLDGLYTDRSIKMHSNRVPARYDQSMLPNHFKRPFNLPTASSCDSDANGHMRASSTTSSSSSSGSGASLTISTLTVPNYKTSDSLNINLHARSYSESITSDFNPFPSRNQYLDGQNTIQRQMTSQPMSTINPGYTPTRPPRGLINNQNQTNTDRNDESFVRKLSENRNDITDNPQFQTSVDVSSVKPLQHFNINGVTNFQPYYEETKPFQMSDFYKYSSKHRQKVNDPPVRFKTTRQLQDDVLRKNSLKFSSCDDQIQASVKLIEKSGQKLIEATAKAIASNPGLAEKLNNILPNNVDRY